MAELAPATIAAVDAYWAAFFGCSSAIFAAPGTTIGPHVGLGDYHGLWLFRRRERLIVSVPPARLDHEGRAFAGMTAASCADLSLIRSRIAMPIERIIGPAWIGYADESTFQPCTNAHTRLLTADDRAMFEELRRACSTLDWEHGGSEFGAQPIAGYVLDDAIAAAAGYEIWDERIAHIAVVTHPAYRGRGYGKAVVSAIAQAALEQGLIPQYRTLLTNTASLAVGAALGFVSYAEQIAVRLAC